MARSDKVAAYLEVGNRRTFAGALDWPGWCRSGADEDSALQALLDYGPRYARVLRGTRLGFAVPESAASIVVKEKLGGNATTDFGAPGLVPAADREPLSPDELSRLETVLDACLRTFVTNLRKAEGQSLRTGPRGGGRQPEGILEHVIESNGGYLNQVGWKLQRDRTAGADRQLEQTRTALLSALGASARGEIPPRGPRGGVRWPARYFVRRVAWHVLDHAWEIEDRLTT